MQPHPLDNIRAAQSQQAEADAALWAAVDEAIDAGFTQKAVAEALSIDRTTLWRRLTEYRDARNKLRRTVIRLAANGIPGGHHNRVTATQVAKELGGSEQFHAVHRALCDLVNSDLRNPAAAGDAPWISHFDDGNFGYVEHEAAS
jgi:hypothetical protein